MKINIVPSNSLERQETGILAILGRVILNDHQTTITRCNGILGICDRDEESMWHRTFESCFNCMKERATLAKWCGANIEDLSKYLLTEDIEQTRRWINQVSFEKLLTDTFDGCVPWEWIKRYFASRFNQVSPTLTNRQHEYFIRKFSLSVLRMRIASRRYLFASKPQVLMVADDSDLITQSIKEVAADFGTNLYTFKWRNDLRVIQIEDYHGDRKTQSDIVINNVIDLRNDPISWPSELVDRVDNLLEFMNIEVNHKKVFTKVGNGALKSA